MAADLLFEQAQPAPVDLIFGGAMEAAPGPGDLVFGKRQPSSPNLVFGADPAGGIVPGTDVTLIGYFAALTAEILLTPIVEVATDGAFSGLEVSVLAGYLTNTSRPVTGRKIAPWRRGAAFETGVEDRHEATDRERSDADSRWERGTARYDGVEERCAGRLVRRPVQGPAFHRDAKEVSPGGNTVRCVDASRLRFARASGCQEAHGSEWIRRETRHQDGLRDRRRQLASGFATARHHPGRRQFEAIQSAMVLRRWLGSPWREAVVVPPGLHPSDPTPPAPKRCYTPSTALSLAALAATDGHLLFICENHAAPTPDRGPVVVPVRRVYCVINEVILHRVADGREVPVFSLSLSLDAASWAWWFEAVLPSSAEDLVGPGNASGPVELLASVNGVDFRVLAEDINRERIFGDAAIRISGRGRNAVLAEPYAPVMTFSNAEARTARQLMDDVLTINGVPLGWTVDWDLTDWNVPAGAFAAQGTWIEALTAIAGAAGGYLLPHPTAQSIRVRHRYPVAPWAWNTVTPDFVLPVDAVVRESLRWRVLPAYNRVFVSGQEVGVLGQVTRLGTAGDVLAPMVVDALITEAAAARQRGIAVLADTGRQIEVNLRLPVLAETGIIEPGAFVEYRDGGAARLGLVRSTNVQAGWPEVWQTLGIQAHA